MSPADLATTSDTLVWLAVLSYVVAATLFGLEFAYRTRWFGVAGLTVTVAGLAANVGAAVTRGLAVHRVPWGNMYEFSIIVGIITVSGFLIWLSRRPDIRPLGMFVLLPAVLAMALGGLVFRVPAGPLVPALNSRWIVIHVAAAITGSSVLCLAAVFSILYLVKDRMEQSGMRWTVEGAQAMLHLRATYLNGQWDEFIEDRIEREQAELYAKAAA